MTKKIAILPGDGIGPEIVNEAVKVMDFLKDQGELNVELEEAPVGGAGYDAAGDPLPAETLALAKVADAILLGAVGGPQYESLPREKRPEKGLLGLRSELTLFSNLRPAILYPQLADASSLKAEIVAGLDIMIVRELTGVFISVSRVVSKPVTVSATVSIPPVTAKARSNASVVRLSISP
jgi:3-isopropylmalate dehydrogenase